VVKAAAMSARWMLKFMVVETGGWVIVGWFGLAWAKSGV
jgi:hypothetical protein